MRHVAVLVLGDVGRSPRMQYHCMSLASMPDTQVRRFLGSLCRRFGEMLPLVCLQVSLIGFQGEACAPVVENNPNIKRYNVAQPFAKANRKFFLLYAPFKVLFQVGVPVFAVIVMVRPRLPHRSPDIQYTVDIIVVDSAPIGGSGAKSAKVTEYLLLAQFFGVSP
jgi:hypothetical protein